MAQVDKWAAARVGIFFPAHNSTPADGNLTGQCVTLLKWFFHELANVPNPFSARGDARYVGHTLVQQGLAVEVPFSNRKPGDVVCYEYGTYGHIVLQLSGGMIFEQNVNMPGTTRRLVDGAYVYSARIASENESWRAGKNPHVYRLKTYSEGGDMLAVDVGYDGMNRFHHQIVGNWDMNGDYWNSIQGRTVESVLIEWRDHPAANTALIQQMTGEQAIKDEWPKQIYALQDQLKAAEAANAANAQKISELQTQVTQQQATIDDMTKVMSLKDAKIEQQAKEIESLKAQIGEGQNKWEIFKALIRELLDFSKKEG